MKSRSSPFLLSFLIGAICGFSGCSVALSNAEIRGNFLYYTNQAKLGWMVLEKTSSNDISGAIELLEDDTDYSVVYLKNSQIHMVAGIFDDPGEEKGLTTMGILMAIAKYRMTYPRKTNAPDMDRRVKEVLHTFTEQRSNE